MIDGIVGKQTRAALKSQVISSVSNNSHQTINDTLYTTTNVYLRKGPDKSYPILCLLNANASVFVYQIRNDGWAYAKINNQYGYIFSDYLSFSPLTTSTESTLPPFQRNSSQLLSIIQNCKSYYSYHDFIYSLADGARFIPADTSKLVGGHYCVDCSSYVSWVLYEYALARNKEAMKNYFCYQRSSRTFASIGASGGNDYLTVISAKSSSPVNLSLAKPGDILVSEGHVEFFQSYTQNGPSLTLFVYNCGSNNSIAIDGVSVSATKTIGEISYILRVK